MSVYVASSWRNRIQPAVVATLRFAAKQYPELEPYDFRNPEPGDDGFRWSEVGLQTGNDEADPDEYLLALGNPRAVEGYAKDLAAMRAADTFVLVLPCGRSAHLELGWAIGMGKRTVILLDNPVTPELMYKLADGIVTNVFELLGWLGVKDEEPEQAAACTRCAGCGKIADSEDGEPWTYWLELPLQSALAVTMGVVKPIDCPACDGTGHRINKTGAATRA